MFAKIALGILGTACGLIVVGVCVGTIIENKRLKKEAQDSNYVVVKGHVVSNETK